MRKQALIFWLALITLFFAFAGRALTAHFSADDTNALHTYWTMGWQGLLKANVLFFSPAFRPMGGLFYFTLYSLFGLEITVFRIACFAFILCNIVLLYMASREITRDAFIAAAATALGSVHPSLQLIWYSNGTIFDVLCYTFYYAALIFYLRGKAEPLVLILFAAALNSKEMAISLPAVCLIHEYFTKWRRWRLLALMALMTIAYVVGKNSGALAASASYHPVLTYARYMDTSRSLLGNVFLIPFSNPMVLALYILIALHLAYTRSREMTMAAVIAILGFVPLNFITPREPFVVYLPLGGWALYAALTMRQLRIRGPALAVGALAIALAANVAYIGKLGDPIGAQAPMGRLVHSIRTIKERPRPGSCLLFTADPFFPDWDTWFLGKIYFNDHSLKFQMMMPDGKARADECTRVDYRLIVEQGQVQRMEEVR